VRKALESEGKGKSNGKSKGNAKRVAGAAKRVAKSG
jgi:hypothetical protein